MISGYMCLGAGQEFQFPHFTQFSGDPVGPYAGRWKMDTDLRHSLLSIPSRDKQVQLFFNKDQPTFAASIASIDSDEPGLNYKSKLRLVLESLSPEFTGAVNNISTKSHRTLALMTNDEPMYFHGLFDLQLKSSYLLWSSSLGTVTSVVQDYPLRFLIYRFPVLERNVVFLPAERVCAKWWTWSKRSDSGPLQPFNALEHMLFS